MLSQKQAHRITSLPRNEINHLTLDRFNQSKLVKPINQFKEMMQLKFKAKSKKKSHKYHHHD